VAIGGNVGFDLLAIAMIGMFGSAVWNAWVLISEVGP
jgi:nitrate reductase NapE component